MKITARRRRGAAGAVCGVAAGRVVLQRAVGDAHLGLVDFDGVELGEAAFDRGRSAGERDQRMIEAGDRQRAEEQPAPIAFGAAQPPLAVVGRVERAARAVAIVEDRREDDRLGRGALRR